MRTQLLGVLAFLFTQTAALFGIVREEFRERITDSHTEHNTGLVHTVRLVHDAGCVSIFGLGPGIDSLLEARVLFRGLAEFRRIVHAEGELQIVPFVREIGYQNVKLESVY